MGKITKIFEENKRKYFKIWSRKQFLSKTTKIKTVKEKTDELDNSKYTNFYIRKRQAWVLSRFRGVWVFAAPGTAAHQAPRSVEFSRQEYWRGLPFPSPGGLPHSGTEPVSLESPVLAGSFLTTSTTWEALHRLTWKLKTEKRGGVILEELGEDSGPLQAEIIVGNILKGKRTLLYVKIPPKGPG